MWLSRLRVRKGVWPLSSHVSEDVMKWSADGIDRWAEQIDTYLNITPLLKNPQ